MKFAGLALTVLSCFTLGLMAPSPVVWGNANSSQHLSRFVEALEVVKARALNAPAEAVLLEGASLGLVKSLDDPYSVFLNAEQYKALQSQRTGEVVGIGMELAYREEQAVVVSVLPGTPAERVGLKAGDRLLAVNESALQGLSWAEINARLQGPEGEVLALRWQSLTPARQKLVREARIQREVLTLESFQFESQTEQRCILRVHTFFNDNLAEEVKSTLESATDTCEQGLVLDLRNNPGGLVEQAVEMAALLGVEGNVFQLQTRDGKVNSIPAPTSDFVWLAPIVVLMDQSSASAAELLAAALRESGRAILMGETTFGKGLVQSLFPLYNDMGLSLTTARYLTRLGNPVHQLGIAPDVVIQSPESAPGLDISEQIALDYLR